MTHWPTTIKNKLKRFVLSWQQFKLLAHFGNNGLIKFKQLKKIRWCKTMNCTKSRNNTEAVVMCTLPFVLVRTEFRISWCMKSFVQSWWENISIITIKTHNALVWHSDCIVSFRAEARSAYLNSEETRCKVFGVELCILRIQVKPDKESNSRGETKHCNCGNSASCFHAFVWGLIASRIIEGKSFFNL